MIRWKRIKAASLLLVAACLFTLSAPIYAEDEQTAVEAAYEEKIAGYSAQLEQLAAERAAIEEETAGAKADKEREQAAMAAIEQQISITQREIAVLMERYGVLEEKIADTKAGIEELEERIGEKEEEHKQKYGEYLTRLQGMQLFDEGTNLGLLLGADSYTEYLVASELMSRIANHDRALMAEIKERRQELEQDQRRLEQEMLSLQHTQLLLNAEQETIAGKQRTLAEQQQQVGERLMDIERMEREYLADLENNRRRQAQMQAELDRAIQELEQSRNPYVGGAMQWPAPGYKDISSYYGPRFQGADFHTGNDIYGSGIDGKEVVAANDGVVSLANWNHTPGEGYGIYVVIDHGITENGDSLVTLYAHLSNIQVEVGQQVTRGQVIGNVGSTGWSTGPHLHFEVRLNKQHTDSLPYIT